MSQEELINFLDEENSRIEKEQKQMYGDKGYNKFWKAPNGTTVITVNPRMPRIVEGKYGKQRVFEIVVGEDIFDWGVNIKSPVYQALIKAMRKADGKTFDMEVTRVGQGKQTRYEVFEA